MSNKLGKPLFKRGDVLEIIVNGEVKAIIEITKAQIERNVIHAGSRMIPDYTGELDLYKADIRNYYYRILVEKNNRFSRMYRETIAETFLTEHARPIPAASAQMVTLLYGKKTTKKIHKTTSILPKNHTGV